MSSSIFNFDAVARAWRLPVRVKVAWLSGAVATAVVLWVCVVILASRNPAIRLWNMGAGEVLFVGTSHTANGIDTTVFAGRAGRVFFPGLDLRLAAATIAAHQDRWPQLEHAFLEVDEFSLLTDMTATQAGNPVELLARLDLSLPELPPAPDRGRLWQARTLLGGKGTLALDPSVRFNSQRLLFVRAAASERLPLTEAAGHLRVQYLQRISRGSIAENIDALVEMSRLLAARGVKVRLLSYPQHAYYRRARPAEWDHHIVQAVAAAKRAVGAIEYWDLRDDPAFTDEDFINVDHLSETGARKLSRIIAGRMAAGDP